MKCIFWTSVFNTAGAGDTDINQKGIITALGELIV